MHALEFVKEFKINELDCIYSDGHSLLSTNIVNYNETKNNSTATKTKMARQQKK